MQKELKKIELDDRQIIEKKLRSSRMLCCEYSFQNLFIWGEIYNTKWAIDNDSLYLFYAEENSLLMPIPEPPLNVLVKIPERFNLGRSNLYISHVEDDYIKSNPDIHKYFEVNDDPDFIDYVHLIDRLTQLKGTKLSKKKNLISQFIRNYPQYQIKIIDSQIKNDCLALYEDWFNKHNQEQICIRDERIAIQNAFKFFEQLSLEGIAIFAEGKLCAFSVFSRQNEETYIEHFEKADQLIKGSAQVINYETAKYLKGKAKYLNREQDIGMPGLRKAKSSYDPDLRLGGKTLKYLS